MTAAESMALLNFTHWVCIADFHDFGGPSFKGDMVRVFDDACDQYAEAMTDEGAAARVYQINFAGNAITDVTDQARDRIAQWLAARGDSLPDWLCAA